MLRIVLSLGSSLCVSHACRRLWLTIVSFTLMGVSAAFAVVPVYADILGTVKYDTLCNGGMSSCVTIVLVYTTGSW